MKYIKNYGTKSEFISAGNSDEFTYYVRPEDREAEDEIYYRVSAESGETFEERTHPGIVKEITPGVAYVNESGATYYNGATLPKLEFTISTADYSREDYTWEELGITEETYQKYVSLAKSYSHPTDFNISINGSTAFRFISWRIYREEMTETNYTFDEVWLAINDGSAQYSVTVRRNLTVDIDATKVIVVYSPFE